MSIKLKMAALLAGVSVVLALSALFGQGNLFEAGRDVPEILHLVDRAYVDKVEMQELMPGMYQGALDEVDENASFIDAETAVQPWDELVYRKWGLVLRKRNGYAYLLAVTPNHPLREQGLQPGKYLRKINGTTTRTLNLVAIRNLLLDNQPELTVELVNRPDGKESRLILTKVDLEPTRVGRQSFQDGLHLFSLPEFHQGFDADLKKFVAEIVADPKAGTPRLVLDLRNNALGNSHDFVTLAQLFLRKGKLGTWQSKKDDPRTLSLAGDGPFASFDLFVLINQSTSRAAEWFAAAAADRGAAVLVGEASLSLAPVFEVFPLKNGAKLEIPTRRLILPSGRTFGAKPLKPNHEITQPEQERLDDQAWLDQALSRVRGHQTADKKAG
ncbi:S41 family peptidase [Acanthopleuribacter pedis]|uniref:Tail specific protease domain-containing protein n=1 Tax=Acanthopleuribacter pedis TaxID=442870 RepID=A0A8J7U2L7_9BACT|nr:S41 family peptidase [Acanthopleuribacter pedis]MBO1317849.1 hypothetical protein [Acanthopleuribacter pedis]